jgi:predicted SnoaL-like aldol condensation-catalyzing enzyme
MVAARPKLAPLDELRRPVVFTNVADVRCSRQGAFDALFNRRDFAAAEQYFSPTYMQHSVGIAPGRDGLFTLVRGLTRRYESALAIAEGDYVMVHGRFSGGGRPTRVVVDILRIAGGRLAEHWDVVQDEATRAESKSGLPMFGEAFPE